MNYSVSGELGQDTTPVTKVQSRGADLRLLGTNFAAPTAVGVVGAAVATNQVIAIPAGVGFGVDPAQALLATSAGPLAVPLAAPLGPFPPDLQQLVLQAPVGRKGRKRGEEGKELTSSGDQVWLLIRVI